ncbi:MAG: hypothetical protein RLY97_884 [Pseudomonadota bacterium]
MRGIWARIDPIVRLLLAAMLLATVFPVVEVWRDFAQSVTTICVFLLFLIYGLKLSRAEVRIGMRNHRLLYPLLGFVFGVMVLAGWLIWRGVAGYLAPSLALGFLFVGVLPSTVQSATVYTSLARGNVASSVVAAALVNIAGVFISAPLFALLAGGKAAGVNSGALIKVLTTLLLPFVIGQVLQGWLWPKLRQFPRVVMMADRSSLGIAVYIAFSGAVVDGLWTKLGLGAWAAILIGCAVLLLVGYGGAWLLGGILRLTRGDQIAMLFAGAQKSAVVGVPLASVLFHPAVAGMVMIPLLTYHLAQMLVAAPIAGRLARGGHTSSF